MNRLGLDMHFANFDLEYAQSIWEQRVDIDLTGVAVQDIQITKAVFEASRQ